LGGIDGDQRAYDGGIAVTADQAQMDVVSDKGNHAGPIELMPDVLDHFGNAQVSSKAMVIVGVKDIQSDILIVKNIE